MKLIAIPLHRSRKMQFCAFCSGPLRGQSFKIVPVEAIEGGPARPVYVHRPGECKVPGERRPDISLEFYQAATQKIGQVLDASRHPRSWKVRSEDFGDLPDRIEPGTIEYLHEGEEVFKPSKLAADHTALIDEMKMFREYPALWYAGQGNTVEQWEKFVKENGDRKKTDLDAYKEAEDMSRKIEAAVRGARGPDGEETL